MTAHAKASGMIRALNPTADRYGGEAGTLSPRPTTLEGRTIGLLWNGKPNGDVALEEVGEELRRRFPTIDVRLYHGSMPSSRELLEEIAGECDAVVACTAD